MPISKKKQKQIKFISHIGDVITQFSGMSDRDFIDNSPDFWTPEERRIFDMLTEQEMRIKQEVFEILGIK